MAAQRGGASPRSLVACARADRSARRTTSRPTSRSTRSSSPRAIALELLIRVPLAAMIEVDFPTRGPGYLDFSRADDALRDAIKLYLIDNITLYENDVALPPPAHRQCAGVAGVRPLVRVIRAGARARGRSRRWRTTWISTGTSSCSTCCWNIQSAPTAPSSRSAARRPVRADRLDRASLPATRRRRTRAFEFHGDPGLVPLDPRWHQAALRFVESGFWHILEGIDHLLFLLCLVVPFRRLRPLVIIVTVVHRRAFDLADRLGLRLRAGRALVSAAHRDADRGHHRLHGAGKHRLCGDGDARGRRIAALDHRFRVRDRARLRLFVRAARIAAICRRPSDHRAVRLQSRGRDRPDRGAAGADPRARPAVQIRGRRNGWA